MNEKYGKPPVLLGEHNFELSEVMYYLYLPVQIDHGEIRLPRNVEPCRALIENCLDSTAHHQYHYAYLSARKGYATPDNPLNRPGWHCDGFGTDDLNFVWWRGPGTRFAVQTFHHISNNHLVSLQQFERQVNLKKVRSYPEAMLYGIDPYVVHSTPLIEPPGCMRQYVKVSLSDHRYNLENNSHNWLFDYDWPLSPRESLRNDPHRAQRDNA